jgi:hypothetical protein
MKTYGLSHEQLAWSRSCSANGRRKTRAPSAFSGIKAFAEAGITHQDVDHLMIYDAPCSLPGASFAHPPIYGLGFVLCGEAGDFIAGRRRHVRHLRHHHYDE